MKKQSHEMAHTKACNAMNKVRHESETWINANLHLVAFPPLQLYHYGGNTRWWVSNDSLLGLRFLDWEYRFSDNPPIEATRRGTTVELSNRAIAVLHDHMLEHWNSKESKSLQRAAARIKALMENPASAGEHPNVKAITALVESLQAV